jgi:hypothetical protein
MIKKFLFFSVFITISIFLKAQDDNKGHLSGDVMINATVYDRDTNIGTSTTQYLHEKSSAEGWFTLNYRIQGWSFMTRFDLYNNSPLLNPNEAYTKQGLAFYQIDKKIGKWEFTAGHFYDQFGSGILFRAYEDRLLGLDYAIQGLKVQYIPNDSFMVKAFTGQQKNRFDVWNQVMKGVNAEKIWGIGDFSFLTGIGFLNRTLDQATMNKLADQINAMPDYSQRFIPKYNMYAGTIYNTLTYKNFSLYTEYAKKSREAVFVTDDVTNEVKLKNLDGDVIYAGLNYSFYGFGLNLQYKKINSFIMRSSPYATLLDGIMDYLPALSKQISFRLPALYSVSAQSQGEQGYQGEITYSINKHNSFDFNASYIQRPNGTLLYREFFGDYNRTFSKRVKGEFGVQSLIYNFSVYEGHPGDVVHTITPFMEMSIRLDNPDKISPNVSEGKVPLRPSLRFEVQYLSTKQDSGSYAYALVELNLAPKYSFAVSDMYNIIPSHNRTDKINYYSFFFAYTEKQTRLTIGYAKQVAGVVCTGGVCRVEPAFSGLRLGLSTNF